MKMQRNLVQILYTAISHDKITQIIMLQTLQICDDKYLFKDKVKIFMISFSWLRFEDCARCSCFQLEDRL
jgi:hypothetical protein